MKTRRFHKQKDHEFVWRVADAANGDEFSCGTDFPVVGTDETGIQSVREPPLQRTVRKAVAPPNKLATSAHRGANNPNARNSVSAKTSRASRA